MTLGPYPLYCPNIFLFLKLKHAVQGKSFHNVRAIQEQVQVASVAFSTQMLLNASNSDKITGLTVCKRKEIAWKATAWKSTKML